MLRITKTGENGRTVCLKVEGRVVGDWVSEFDKVCRSSLAQGKVISLDFAGVLFIDHQGVEAVKGMLGEKNVQLTGASLLVQDLLDL